ncbi:sulfate transporter CysZ [Pseudidiomarina terrestris]|uniref:sulfate transporter CysZ n=1 Tax=Pseudidiomarina terrestris TaxID=2820060 RepID=UPI0026516847|nr:MULTISPECIES: sulfate transporter CysZ [unclassified Pseudidiomarina]MDN7136327.1 sulfate transporter CysZ [Pseudidiomarina sp. 1ASP75-5]MDN7138756.1 sulfate transporter CysZ [Pseudidiomarina sp. 1ASP75-14]
MPQPAYSDIGASYVARGFELAFQKGVRRYAIIPLSINIVLFSIAIYFIFHYTAIWVADLVAWLPEWLRWLEVVVWPLIIIGVLLLFALTFTSVANIIASPFNSLLAEKVEERLTGIRAPGGGVAGMIKDIPRTFGREMQKLVYFIPRTLGFLLLLLFLPVIGQILWLLWGGWMMTIQYADYAFDNHKIPFRTMRSSLHTHQGKSLTFGVVVAFLASIPVVNLIMIPVAVCGSTAMWVDHMRGQNLP